MLIQLNFKLKNRIIDTADCNMVFNSIIRSLIQVYDPDVYRSVYRNTAASQFTWSLRLPKVKHHADHTELKEPEAQVLLSLWDSEANNYGISLACTSRADQQFRYGGNIITLTDAEVLSQKQIVSDSCIFASVRNSPVLLTDPHRAKETFCVYDAAYERQLYLSLCSKLRNAQLPQSMIESLHTEIIRTKDTVALLDETAVNGTYMTIKMKGDTRVLNYIAQTGIGVYNAHGYGMMNAVYQDFGPQLRIVK